MVAVVYLRTMTSRLASLLTNGQGTVVVHHTKAQQQLSRHRNATHCDTRSSHMQILVGAKVPSTKPRSQYKGLG